jgi:hypothetical protein
MSQRLCDTRVVYRHVEPVRPREKLGQSQRFGAGCTLR